MRWLPFVAVAACQLEHPAADRPSPAPAPPPAPSIVAPATPLVPPPLSWGLSPQEAFERLAAAGLAPRADEQRGYFTSPDQGHAAPGTIAVAHTSEPVVTYTPRPGWTATVHYPTYGVPMDSIDVQAALTADEARAELRALERRHGPPVDRRLDDGAPGAERLVWIRGGVWLVATASRDGALWLSYRRDPRPASALAP